jgi:26S proteasome regulatory subunit N8
MLAMFRKVNAKERVVGFYSTGPQIRSNDLRIYDIVERFTGNKHTATTKQPIPTYPPVFCIIDIRPDRPALPVTAYKVIEQVVVGGSSSPTLSRTFAHVSVEMGAMEAEEIGVEHLLRDVHDPTVSTTAALVQNKLRGLETLHEKLCECRDYLLGCCSGGSQTTTPNPEILANLQTILSLLPNLNNEHLVRSMIIKMNDYYMAIYLAALIRSIMALHDLINNKLRYGPDGTEYREEEAMKQAEAKIADEEKKEEDEKRSTGDNNSSSTTKKQDKKTQDK